MPLHPLVAAFWFAACPAGAQGASPFPSERDLRAEAQAYVAELCKEQPDSCETARRALAGYREILEKLRACETRACDGSALGELYRDSARLDRDAARLEALRTRPANGLLGLSALCTSRIAAVNARQPAPAYLWAERDGVAQAAKQLEELCLAGQAGCVALRSAFEEARKAASEIRACEAAACPFATIDPLVERAYGAMLGTLGRSALDVFSYANEQDDRSVALLAALVERLTAALESETAGLETRVAAVERGSSADIADIPRRAEEATARYQEAAIASDRLLLRLGYEKAAANRDRVNAATIRLSGLRSKARALALARGLRLGAGDAGAAPTGGGPASGPRATPPAAGAGAGTAVPSRPTLLDARTVPMPPSGRSPPPILPGSPSWIRILGNAVRGNEVEKADARRRLGLTRTLGNPGAYADLVYRQAAATTCSVATQVQVLRMQGFLPKTGEPAAQEAQLAREAERRGFKSADGGTPPEFSGGLLVARGMTVTKHVQASWSDLEAALRRGSILQAAVDAKYLWGLTESRRLSHSILVTGAEVEARTGRLLGVYINDTGDDPPKGGRFLTPEQFKRAWTGAFAEIR